jgi:hypothetical protein
MRVEGNDDTRKQRVFFVPNAQGSGSRDRLNRDRNAGRVIRQQHAVAELNEHQLPRSVREEHPDFAVFAIADLVRQLNRFAHEATAYTSVRLKALSLCTPDRRSIRSDRIEQRPAPT